MSKLYRLRFWSLCGRRSAWAGGLSWDSSTSRGAHGGDSVGRFHVTHAEAEGYNWAEGIGAWLEEVARNASHHSGHHEGGHHGGGMAGMAVGGAIGVAGGLVAAAAIDEIGDTFEDEN